MNKIILGLLILGLTPQINAQEPTLTVQLPEVYIVHNYKYLSSANSEEAAIPVENLQIKVSDFNIKDLDVYTDENDLYDVYFIIPEGKVLASYNDKGILLSTAERYTDTELPSLVVKAINNRFPNWSVTKNVYLVNYHESSKTKKLYKITLENGNRRIRVKVDEMGLFQ
ncbi:nicotinate-nucleotide adenylyltransferase [Algibacter sp. L4_22]|uniref:nicotinate-nucleotide adenylyltransferase n=1 Tax=Algibacter sp. L4_22 TaxID=2942477 RepID=UPI00201B7BE0|nr:nicotinate-nucleotide adenylyltransferase [Algibacter sp. L4_22]MCL5129891.1 nicotinate-nucleotide adenylyltransferase [Algibacter sp. L4_22]